MRIGILGSGTVGQTLAAGFVKHGHEVRIGTRDAAKLADWAKGHLGVQVTNPAEAARFAEAGVLAVKGTVAAEALRGAAGGFDGKAVLDATNPIADAPPVNGVLRFFTNLDESLLERLQREFPAVRLVKAFNSVGAPRMIDPQYKEGRPTMFICGADAGAKGVASALIADLGWEAEDMGSVEAARAIEPLCMLWCIPGFARNQWTHAFKLLRN